MSAAYGVSIVFIAEHEPLAAAAALAVAVLLHAAWITHALLHPTRSLQDSIAGTRLVPR
jgi:hypothetical protein